jgi:hypothetical protein
MCRNIQSLFNFDPPATEEEAYQAALQYVRKISGMRAPSQANQATFDAAVKTIAEATTTLLRSLETSAPPKDRATEAAKAREKSARRFSR